MAQYKALSFLYHLFVAGGVMERATLIDQILSHGVVGVLLQVRTYPYSSVDELGNDVMCRHSYTTIFTPFGILQLRLLSLFLLR